MAYNNPDYDSLSAFAHRQRKNQRIKQRKEYYASEYMKKKVKEEHDKYLERKIYLRSNKEDRKKIDEKKNNQTLRKFF